MNPKLYQADLSPYAARVRVQVYAKNAPVDFLPPPGGLKSPEYLAINPLGKVPCLEHDGMVLPESETIFEYLEDLYPQTPLLPGDAKARARARLISRMTDLYVTPPLTKLFGQMNPKTRDQALVDQAFKDLDAAFANIVKFIEGPTYAVGGRLTLADAALVPFLFFVVALGPALGRSDPFAAVPKLKDYFGAASKDPHLARVVGEMQVALAERMKGG